MYDLIIKAKGNAMTKKITKKQYETRKNALEKQLLKLNNEENYLKYEAMNTSNDSLLSSYQEEFNEIYDEQYRIEEKMKSLEREWSTRNWTYQDRVQHDLIMQNID
jgi:predicted  nucleic acid-binding Zn-ribbon protein